MELTDIPTERTTAATDVLLALLAVAAALYVWQVGKVCDAPKARIWAWAFGLVALAAALGAIAHGFKMSPRLNKLLWQPLYMALGWAVALFAVGVIYDAWGGAAARRLLPILLAAGVAFYLLTRVLPQGFLVFVLYEAVAMVFALVAYLRLAWSGRLPGAWAMVAGILVTLTAAGLQASEAVSFRLVWPFDHNGVFHLAQMVGVVLLTAGLRVAFLASALAA
jgi:hypothetical protein